MTRLGLGQVAEVSKAGTQREAQWSGNEGIIKAVDSAVNETCNVAVNVVIDAAVNAAIDEGVHVIGAQNLIALMPITSPPA